MNGFVAFKTRQQAESAFAGMNGKVWGEIGKLKIGWGRAVKVGGEGVVMGSDWCRGREGVYCPGLWGRFSKGMYDIVWGGGDMVL